MKPFKVSRISIAYLALVGVLTAGMLLYTWLKIQSISKDVYAQELAQAVKEVSDALQVVDVKMRDAGQTLANWDETRQQLLYHDYYNLWRDQRVRDANILPHTVDAIALYTPDGNILAPNPPDAIERMPDTLPIRPPGSIFLREAGHDHIYYFFPVYLDMSKDRLIGYGGIKFDFVIELALVKQFRYADLSRMSSEIPLSVPVEPAKILKHLRFGVQQNLGIENLQGILKQSLLQFMLLFILTLGMAFLLLRRYLIQPMHRLSQDIDGLRDTQSGSTANEVLPRSLPLPIWELENVRNSFLAYHDELSKLHGDLEQKSRDFFDQARRDALSGILNRRAYDELVKRLEDGHYRDHALILFDCDHFKAINDTYGHPTGDRVICAIAECLRQALRADDCLYRLGGDEFATLLPNTDINKAEVIAERCQEHMARHDFAQYGILEPVTISIGIALGRDAPSIAALQKHADLAMYAAKRPGHSKVVLYDESLGDVHALVANREITAVFEAIQNPSLIRAHYQPVVRLADEVVVHVEALARIDMDGQLISPGAIFPIVQARRLDAEFDLAMIQAIARDMAAKAIPGQAGIAINLSGPGLVNGKVIDAVISLKQGHPASKIAVEITETALITQLTAATEHIERLRRAGCHIALDDFGSGYSSLRYLASMPVDSVKLDISMVEHLHSDDPRQRALIEDIVEMLHGAGYEVVAEGIEDLALLDRVRAMGIAYGQGYYLGRPAPAESAPSRLASQA